MISITANRSSDARFSIIGAVRTFTALDDTPTSFTGSAGYHVAVNSGETAVEFVPARELLTADRTFFVRSDGSDTNTGLTNTAAGAFQTIQHATDNVWNNLDLGGFTVTINVSSGTYNGTDVEGILISGNQGEVHLIGDTTTPSNVVLNGTISLSGGAVLHYGGFKHLTTSDPALYIHGEDIGLVATLYQDYKVEFGTCSAGDGTIKVAEGANVFLREDFTIIGSHDTFMDVNMGGRLLFRGADTITLSSASWTTCFAATEFGGAIRFGGGLTFSGSATGKRFSVANNSWIYTNTSETYLPGSIAGTVESGGVYDGREGLTSTEYVVKTIGDHTEIGVKQTAVATTTTDGAETFESRIFIMVDGTLRSVPVLALFGATTYHGWEIRSPSDDTGFDFKAADSDKSYIICDDSPVNFTFADTGSVLGALAIENAGVDLTPARFLHLRNTKGDTNTVTPTLRIDYASNDTPANGIGTGIEFGVETATDNHEIGARFDVIAVDTTSTSEDFRISLKTMVGGATATEQLALERNATATHTALLIWDNDNATVERVTVGAGDSGGAGFKVLRIPN